MTLQDSPTLPAESGYLDYLPAIFRTPQRDGTPNILGQFLRAFEDVLTGTGNAAKPGVAETINGIGPIAADGSRPLAGLHRYFEPGHDQTKESRERAPKEFLDWLAGWVALSLRADIPEETQREFIANAASIYRIRGTPRGLAKLLEIYTGLKVTVDEGSTGFRIMDAGPTAIVGMDNLEQPNSTNRTILAGFKPHYFEVTLLMRSFSGEAATTPAANALPDQPPKPSLPVQIERYRAIAAAIIDAEKPAHCYYQLNIQSVAFQVGVTSRIGINTLLAPKHS